MDKQAAIRERDNLPDNIWKKRLAQERKERTHRERACFWTFPWGHVWDGPYKDRKEGGETVTYRMKSCLCCNKEKHKYHHNDAGFY